ncbi:GNAT family N-acetyltransferase [Chengkuizengella axinellae]|uniref:GNAT family N-acetyltransferase n=1 Tax=Chengkuizengella axinellae TaxID=3064388 RepID=A0ABT9J295_9BACL|nr:GNAT family N-acetyltransferase [Chengkuizengella sp. 2205SS18-9]MDP5275688.1 GNAT family N-acetyltransferase [Chengkuizengella sp. 2205SS18-9]
MNLTFKNINQNNWKECIALKVHEYQESFVASNWYSLLEAKYQGDQNPLAIYNDEMMIGFLMYGVEPETQRLELCRFMIDKKFQQKGYGRASLNKLLSLIKEKYGDIDFYTSAEPDNINTIKLYEDVGFIKTGEVMWGEIVLKIKL